MAFNKCPECGNTNFEEDSSNLRTFDCGFSGQWDRRVKRCRNPRPHTRGCDIPAEVNRFRLALLDAAHAAETIAADLVETEDVEEFAERLQDLARQMRAAAGHDGSSAPLDGGIGGRFLGLVRKFTG
jgi:hypothetical protein